MTDEINSDEISESADVGEQRAERPEEGQVVRRRSQDTTNPFDYPFVFPGLLFALMLWFGWDGWMNPSTKSVMFNRIMCVVFAIASVWTGWVDWRVSKKLKARKAEAAAAAEAADS